MSYVSNNKNSRFYAALTVNKSFDNCENSQKITERGICFSGLTYGHGGHKPMVNPTSSPSWGDFFSSKINLKLYIDGLAQHCSNSSALAMDPGVTAVLH